MIFCGLKDDDNTHNESRRSSPRISLFFLVSLLKAFGLFSIGILVKRALIRLDRASRRHQSTSRPASSLSGRSRM